MLSRSWMWSPGALLVLSVAVLMGCRAKPEAQSGGDGYRHEAQPLALEAWTTDDLAAGSGDTTDWKSIEISSPAQMIVELRADEADAEFVVGAYDRYGAPLGKVERRAEVPVASFGFNAATVGTHFIMVRATGGPPSSYTIRVRSGDSIEGGTTIRPDF